MVRAVVHCFVFAAGVVLAGAPSELAQMRCAGQERSDSPVDCGSSRQGARAPYDVDVSSRLRNGSVRGHLLLEGTAQRPSSGRGPAGSETLSQAR